MKDIKRYEFNIEKVEYGNGAVEIKEEEYTNGDHVKYVDHTAVVETKDEIIKEQYEVIQSRNKSQERLLKQVETMQNKIEELESIRIELFDSNVDKDIDIKLMQDKTEELEKIKCEMYNLYFTNHCPSDHLLNDLGCNGKAHSCTECWNKSLLSLTKGITK